MKAVVFKGKLEVKVEDRPIPQIIDQTDMIIKVKYSALCGRYDRINQSTSFRVLTKKPVNFTYLEVTSQARRISSWSVS